MLRVFTLFWGELETPFWLRVWDCVMMLPKNSKVFFLGYLFLWIAYLYFIDQVLWLVVAIS